MSRRIAVVSGAMETSLVDMFPKAAGRVAFIPNGVDAGLLALSPARHDRGQALKLLFVGNLIPVKGVEVLLNACASLPVGDDRRWVLRVVGDGSLREALEDHAEALGISERVHFTGRVAAERVQSHLAWAQVLVLPSYREGRPNAVLEAMAAARAVIAADIDGVKELIGADERGMRFPPGDADGLADRIRELERSPRLVHDLGVAARAWVKSEGLTWEAAADGYLGLYGRVLAEVER